MTSGVLINGQPRAGVDSGDRGLHYGDGLFETMAVTDGGIPFLDYHLERLSSGCARLAIPFPAEEVLRAEIGSLSADQTRAVLKLLVTRGSGSRGYRAPRDPQPTRVLYLSPWPEWPTGNATDGVVARFCETRLGRNPRLAGLKHLNRLEQVMARSEWDDPEIAEGLMLDEDDNVIEGTSSNLFVVLGGRLITPCLRRCGVAGVMRRVVLEAAARHGMKVERRDIPQRELMHAEELFLTNSIIGIWPIARLGEKAFGPARMARELSDRIRDRTEAGSG